MTERIFLRLGPDAELGADDLQWILYKAGKPVSFIGATKAVLLPCILVTGIAAHAEGMAALDTLPDSYEAWKSDPTRRGSPGALEPRPIDHPVSKLKAIRTRCLECVDGQAEVRSCAFFNCPLWAFRMAA